MKIGTIQVQIYAPKFLACQPDLNNLPFATDERNKDRVFTEEEYHRIFKSYPYPFVDGVYVHRFKSNGYDCYTKYIFIEQRN